MEKYSVLMSVYQKDDANALKESVDSILNQTVKTDNFVIVKDGPLTDELNQILDNYAKKYPEICIITLKKNVGLGKALHTGLLYCKHELVARMDADDISLATRIEKELEYLKKHPEIDIVGSQSLEFIDDITKPVQYNQYPLTHLEIEKYAHMRNPYSHPSVIFKKSKVLLSGNYQDAYLCEDYDLWIRMIQSGCICANLDEYLLAVRISKDFYKRRSGLKYVKSIHYLMRKNMKIGFFTKGEYIKNMIIRSIVYLMPNTLRSLFYSKILRKGNKNNESITYSA